MKIIGCWIGVMIILLVYLFCRSGYMFVDFVIGVSFLGVVLGGFSEGF